MGGIWIHPVQHSAANHSPRLLPLPVVPEMYYPALRHLRASVPAARGGHRGSAPHQAQRTTPLPAHRHQGREEEEITAGKVAITFISVPHLQPGWLDKLTRETDSKVQISADTGKYLTATNVKVHEILLQIQVHISYNTSYK